MTRLYRFDEHPTPDAWPDDVARSYDRWKTTPPPEEPPGPPDLRPRWEHLAPTGWVPVTWRKEWPTHLMQARFVCGCVAETRTHRRSARWPELLEPIDRHWTPRHMCAAHGG